ncbi:MAG TPA: anaerobic ribonucleoside-triphosphate reductase activating protein [Candidatus Omnitrophota bacterium]|nr:anaerobic ribonucleoside-triphosphate reductase activating protein [Candidatus Omnitrophota bacterium]
MRIGGFQKVSLIDYPGKVAAVVFTQGCNLRCPFCHNTELVIPSCFQEPLSQEEITSFLMTRVGKLQGVVVTGGEPTIQEGLESFLRSLKTMGFSVKLDTNGTRPAVLRSLLGKNLLDFIAMDIKGPLHRYRDITGVSVDTGRILESIHLIRNCGIEFQFRTTIVKPLLTSDEINDAASLVSEDIDHYKLQPFVPQDRVLDPRLLDKAHYTDEDVERIADQCRQILRPASVAAD